MIIEIKPEDETLIQRRLRTGAFKNADEVVHRALIALETSEPLAQVARKPRKNLADFLMESPFAGSEIDLERQQDYGRPVDL